MDGGSADGGSDAAPDTVTDTGAEAAPIISCGAAGECPTGHFCGARSRTCVSAVVEVVGGAHHSCARHASGGVSCWGLAESLRGGGAAVLAPAPVPGLTGVKQLAAGVHQSCAVTAEGQIRCWGNYDQTVLAEGGAPLGGVRAVTLGAGYGCAVTETGIACWGKNDFGQLARPAELEDSGPAIVSLAGGQRLLGAGIAVVVHDGNDRLCSWGRNATKMVTDSDAEGVYRQPQCRTLPDVAALVVGDTHACVRHGAGSFTCWGERYYGQLGIGGTDTADVGPPGAPVSLPPGVAALAAGVSHTCALLSDGRVMCFGRNSLGQVGPDPGTAEEEVRTPVAVSGLPGPVTALGAGSSAHHTCAILGDGSLMCWGNNAEGQLGNGVPAREPGRFSARPVLVGF